MAKRRQGEELPDFQWEAEKRLSGPGSLRHLAITEQLLCMDALPSDVHTYRSCSVDAQE